MTDSSRQVVPRHGRTIADFLRRGRPALATGGRVQLQPAFDGRVVGADVIGEAPETTLGALIATQVLRAARRTADAEAAVVDGGGHLRREKAADASESAAVMLQEIVSVHGWPCAALVGEEAAEAAVLIAARARSGQREQLTAALARAVHLGAVPAWHLQRLGAVVASGLTGTRAAA
ncbi:hypothetical protein [Streptomyces sp. CBMA156]|uniref:hypothetical protein n=1 Tax=Streptomyces sp. CBMA156 TaxID=1930280 RepID=UPI001661F3BE|nr:hypothetical protein [Streptomyces sp. CBMA156]MBD0670405.1 hypothetical protein [Streptomyces sp. CBMA156]